jgi:uncharacterized membrane protein
LKVESAAVATLIVCIFLSFYFAFLSFQGIDDALKKQLVTFAIYFLITGVVILACMAIYIGLKRAFPKVEILRRTAKKHQNQLKSETS